MEDNAQTEDSAGERAAVLLDDFDQLLRGERLFGGVEYVIEYRHRLCGLTATERGQRIQLDEVEKRACAQFNVYRVGECLLCGHAKHFIKLRRLLADVHADDSVGELERSLNASVASGRAPVAETDVDESLVVTAQADVVDIAENRGRVLLC